MNMMNEIVIVTQSVSKIEMKQMTIEEQYTI